jgi:chemotaxis protein methyltransferase CheR
MGRKLGRSAAKTLVVKSQKAEMDMIVQARTSLINRNKPRQLVQLIETNDARIIARGVVDTLREPLLVLDHGLRVVAASRAFCAAFKLDISDIIGRPLDELRGGECGIPELRVMLGQIIPQQGARDSYEVEHDFQSIGRRTMLLNAREVRYDEASTANVFLSIEDVTARRLFECESVELLRQKDILLDEIDHRVANSLQIIASILSMKARKVISGEARRALEDARSRIISIAAVQKHLHASAARGPIALIPYLSNLCKALSESIIGDDQAISIKVQGEGANFDRPKAESVGLIVAELVINSLKHAFGDTTAGGLVVVRFDADEAEWTLSVSDNGGGKQKRAIVTEGGLGTRIVAALARQLNALVVTKSGREGTSVSIIHHEVEAL